jgi:hypothetical protein
LNEKFSIKTKNFAEMSKIVNKDVEDCIQFYYLNKKKENLKKGDKWGRTQIYQNLKKKADNRGRKQKHHQGPTKVLRDNISQE